MSKNDRLQEAINQSIRPFVWRVKKLARVSIMTGSIFHILMTNLLALISSKTNPTSTYHHHSYSNLNLYNAKEYISIFNSKLLSFFYDCKSWM